MKTNWKEMVGGRVLIKSVDVSEDELFEVIVLEVSPKGASVKVTSVEMMPRMWWTPADEYEVVEVLPPRTPLTVMAECWQILHTLREREGNSVTFICDDPDEGGHNAEVLVVAEWTNWETKTYTGHDVHEALQGAMSDYNQHIKAKKS